MSFNDLFKPEEQENPLFKTVPKTFTQTVTTNILKNTSNKNSGNPYRTSYTGTNLGMGNSTYAPKTTNPSPPKSYTASETKKKDLFLEGFYSVADKPKEERRSYNPSPYAKSRAMLDSMTQAKREEEDDFLKGFYSVADRPKEETPTSAYLQTIRQNMQTAYKPGDWLRSTMTKPTLWDGKNLDFSPQKTDYITQNNTPFYQQTYTNTDMGFEYPQEKHYVEDVPASDVMYGSNSGKGLDTLSNFLTAASLIPGVDTFADLVAIPVDLMRDDYLSAGLDLVGVFPFVGEIADFAKYAKIADDVSDAAKLADNISDATKLVENVDDVYDVVKVGADVKSKRSELLNYSSNPKVKNAINQLYRPGAIIGDGGTADAIRHELSTGSSVRGQHHVQKGQDWIRALRKIQEKETLSENEQIIVKELIEDLEKALRGE